MGATIFARCQQKRLQQIVEKPGKPIRPKNDEAIDLFVKRYSYIRWFAPDFLTLLSFRAQRQAFHLLKAVELQRVLNAAGERTVPRGALAAFISDAW